MANTKNVEISGTIPFDCAENTECCRLLGQLNGPTSGLRIKWDQQPTGYQPNEYGGHTAIYGFIISGSDANSWKWFEWAKNALLGAGAIFYTYSVVDPQDG